MVNSNGLAPRSNKGSRNPVSWFKGLDKLSKYFLIIAIVVVLGGIGFGVYSMTKTTQTNVGNFYYDQNLNFSVVIPPEWVGGTPDKASVASATKAVTGGTLFDMRLHQLQTEIVPLTLVVNIPRPTSSPSSSPAPSASASPAPSSSPKTADTITGPAFSKFMTIAFRGVDKKVSVAQDKVKMMDDFKALLKSLGHTDIQVAEVADIKNKALFGQLLKGSGVLLGQRVYYMQYFEPAGKNMLIVTYGSLKDTDEGLKDLDKVIGSLKYLDGGTVLPETFNSGPITNGPQVVPPIDNSANTNPSIKTTPSTNGGDVKAQVDGATPSDVIIKDDKGNVVNKK